jgi:hypothetical protein
MVCYSSMSPLPLQLLCSVPLLYSSLLSALFPHSHTSIQLLFFLYTLCCLCMLYTAPLISSSGPVHGHILPTCITLEKTHTLLCSACLSHAKSSARSSSQLFIFSGGYVESVHHQWSLSKDSLASLAVTTLHLLCQLQPVIFGFFGF